LDDILIYSHNERGHEEHLRLVLQYFKKHRLYGKRSKCILFQREINYLVHVINGEGVMVYPNNIEAIIDWLAQRNAQPYGVGRIL
jgi:hypothetical protein